MLDPKFLGELLQRNVFSLDFDQAINDDRNFIQLVCDFIKQSKTLRRIKLSIDYTSEFLYAFLDAVTASRTTSCIIQIDKFPKNLIDLKVKKF